MEKGSNNIDPTIIVWGGGGGATNTAKCIAEAMPDARIVVVQGTHDGLGEDENGRSLGGSTGVLRRYLHIPGPGDGRNALENLAEDDLGELFGTRYGKDATVDSVRDTGDALYDLIRQKNPDLNETWLAMQLDAADELAQQMDDDDLTLQGHAYGNLVLAASTKNTDDIGVAFKFGSILMNLPENRVVLPSTLAYNDLELHDRDDDGNEIIIRGEGNIDLYTPNDVDYAYVRLTPEAPTNPEVMREARNADASIYSSGSWFTSVLPSALTDNMAETVDGMPRNAKNVALTNLAEDDVTPSIGLIPYYDKLNAHTNPRNRLGREIGYVIINTAPESLPDDVKPIVFKASEIEQLSGVAVVLGGDLVDKTVVKQKANDTVVRSKVHHGRTVGEILRDDVLKPAPKLVTSSDFDMAA